MTQPEGEIVSALTIFLYVLMRDHVPSGAIEKILQDHVAKAAGQRSVFSSPFLRDYAIDLARRLSEPTSDGT